MSRLFGISFGILMAAACWGQARGNAPARRALVLGNAAYQHLPALQSPNANVTAMTEGLRKVGFETQSGVNLSQVAMLSAVRQFMDTIHPGDFVLVYFSGYGSQFERQNYLLPVSFDPKDGLPIVAKTLSVRNLLSQFTQHKAGGRMLLLDASRACPGIPKGLAAMDRLADTLVAFPAAPDQVAADPAGGGIGPFTESLTAAMLKPGSTPAGAVDGMKREMTRRFPNAPPPFVQSGYTGDLVLVPVPPAPTISSFAGTPASIRKGDSTTLQWTVNGDASRISIDPAIGAVPPSGSRVVQPAQTTIYTLTAEGAGGTNSASVNIAVSEPKPAPPTNTVVTLSAPAPSLREPAPAKTAMDPKSAADYEEGYRQYKAGQWQAAIVAYTRVLGRHPGAEGYSERGICYFNLHDYKHALADFSQAIAMQADFASAYFNRAMTQQRLDRCADAVKDFDRALQLNPSEQVFVGRAECYAKLSEPQAAAADYTRAIQSGVKTGAVFRERGKAYIRMAQYRDAVKDLSQAIEHDPDDADALENRASAEKSLGDAAASEEDTRRLHELAELRQVFSVAQQAGLKFYTGEALQKSPKYEVRFPAAGSAPVHMQLDLYLRSAPSFRVSLTLHQIWFRPDGSVDHKTDIKTYVDAGVHNWRQISAWRPSAGAQTPAGIYRVEIYGLDIRLGSGKFEITK